MRLSAAEKGIRASRIKNARAAAYIGICPAREERANGLATADALSAWRSTSGQLQRLAHRSKPDIACEQNRLAKKTPKLTVAGLIATNKLVGYVEEAVENGACFLTSLVCVSRRHVS